MLPSPFGGPWILFHSIKPPRNLPHPFPGDREAQLTVGQDSYGVSLMNLPTVVETYRTMDDENLIKVGDVGQMLLVRPKVRRFTLRTYKEGHVTKWKVLLYV